jgi:pimeloyl-ACP methyl ester carboxylesterase
MREANGIRLHVVTAGDPDDPLVVLLHGFPEFWYGWHRQLRALVDDGFRVLVPDQRGYNRSEKPPAVTDYRLESLSQDVVSLVEGEGRDSAHVVGHDWGGLVAWDLARRVPGVVDRLGIVNVPHLSAYTRTLRSNPRQLARSWYALFFQLPLVPEWLAAQRDFALWTALLRRSTPRGTFSDADLACYRRAWRRPRAPRAMHDWYRALLRYSTMPTRERVDAPVLLVWGAQDAALVPDLAERSLEYCRAGRLARFPDAGHFVHHERPADVGRALSDHLRA